jgi:hypothetical protein
MIYSVEDSNDYCISSWKDEFDGAHRTTWQKPQFSHEKFCTYKHQEKHTSVPGRITSLWLFHIFFIRLGKFTWQNVTVGCLCIFSSYSYIDLFWDQMPCRLEYLFLNWFQVSISATMVRNKLTHKFSCTNQRSKRINEKEDFLSISNDRIPANTGLLPATLKTLK